MGVIKYSIIIIYFRKTEVYPIHGKGFSLGLTQVVVQ